MATKRMFSRKITETDLFLDMSLSTQCLYFHLNMQADDEGFVANAKTVQRMVGANDDDLKMLFAKQFLIPFESGIVVIKDWKIHNYIAKDRFTQTIHNKEKDLLFIDDNNAYSLDNNVNNTKCIQDVYSDKSSIDKSSIDKYSNNIVEQLDFKSVIEYLNDSANTKFRIVESHKKFIRARYNEGYTLEDFKQVIDTKSAEWKNDKEYSKYLRPQTLFGNKFDTYLNQVSKHKEELNRAKPILEFT